MGRYINIAVKDTDDRGEHAFIDFEGMVDGDEVMEVANRIWDSIHPETKKGEYAWYVWVNWLHMSMDTGDWEDMKELDLVATEVLTFIEAYIPPPDKSISVLKCDV